MASRSPKPGACGSPIRKRPGWFCDKPPMDGVTRCRLHGGATPQLQEKRTKGIVRKEMHRMVTAIPKSDIEANPLEAFDVEFRTTIATIRFLNELVTELLDGDPGDMVPDELKDRGGAALFWGVREVAEKTATEFAGVDTTYGAGLHAVEQKRQWEREHLVKMTKVYIDAKVDERRVMMGERVLDTIDKLLNGVIVGLGADPHDPATRSIVTQAFEGIGAMAPKVIDG